MRHLLDTPSDGVDEVCKALQSAHATNDRYVSARRLKRHLPVRSTVADIATALKYAAEAGFVQDDGTDFQLTDEGLAHARNSRAFLAIT